jgi:hypothetical protein
VVFSKFIGNKNTPLGKQEPVKSSTIHRFGNADQKNEIVEKTRVLSEIFSI